MKTNEILGKTPTYYRLGICY